MAVSLAFAAFLLIIDGIFPQGDAGQYPYGYRCGDGHVEVPWWHLFPETRDNAEAFWTAIGSMIGIAALCFIWIQIRKTEEANDVARFAAEQTKRSVDSYVAAERGRLSLVRCWQGPNPSGQTAIWFEFKNTGRSSLRVAFHAEIVERLGGILPSIPPIRTDIRPRSWLVQFVGQNEVFDNTREPDGILIPPHCFDLVTGKPLPTVVQIEVQYRSIDTAYRHHAAWVFREPGFAGSVGIGMMRHPDPAFEFDTEL
jgi:hypothetical protein